MTLRILPTIAATFLISFSSAALAATPAEKCKGLIDKGLAYLKAQQKPDFSWQGPSDPPAFTALALTAFMGEKEYDAEQPFLDKGFAKLLSFQQPDGGIYNGMLANYNTAIAISALAASQEAEYKTQLDKALNFLRGLQWSDQPGESKERQKVDAGNPNFGGWGYGKKGRADNSNLQIALDALHDAGVKPEDPAFQNAVKFVTRCQNNSETNDQKWSGNDGGFIYTPAEDGSSPAGEYSDAGGKKMLRSYGSMTYAGLKSFIYANVSKDDPRVKAAWTWINGNWTLDENPGMKLGDPDNAKSGLYYYFHTLSRALNAYDQPTLTDAQGNVHDWRGELVDKLASLQKADGSWAGEKRWMEDNPVLVTCYCVLALEQAQKDLEEHPAK